MQPTVVVSFGGGVQLRLQRLTVREMRQIKAWTGLTWPRLVPALAELDPDALTALYLIATQRSGQTPPRFEEVDFALEDLQVRWEDDQGVEVEPVWETNPDGSPRLGADGQPVQRVGPDGEPVWRRLDGSPPFSNVPSTLTTSSTPQTLGSSGVSVSSLSA